MAETNFAFLMDMLGIGAPELCKAIGADKSLVSRWRSGGRKLMKGRHWVEKIADVFIEKDERFKDSVILDILRIYYPTEDLGTKEQKTGALIRWLTTAGQEQAEYKRKRQGLEALIAGKIESLKVREPHSQTEKLTANDKSWENSIVYGIAGVQGSTLLAADFVLNMPEPQEITFACPEGLEMYTRDENFGSRLMDALMKLFDAGHRLSVVLRTDYKMSDVSAFSGRWLVAHLLGYIKSYYFDEFHKNYSDKMLVNVGDKMAFCVRERPEGIYTAIHFDKPAVLEISSQCAGYKAKSKQRFHYSYFENPGAFLRHVTSDSSRPVYLYARMPHFAITDGGLFKDNFSLTDEEMRLIEDEFSPILKGVAAYDADIPVRHMFCESDIEGALLKNRHLSYELSAMTNRRVLMTTQGLVNQLIFIKSALAERPNYEVCFMPDDVFAKLTMQIAVWSDRAAIGWIAGSISTACKDYTNVNALAGFCEAVWDKIPGALKLRCVAVRKINGWLKRAMRYGYKVEA